MKTYVVTSHSNTLNDETYVVTPHSNSLNDETVLMMGHKIHFYGEIWLIIPKLRRFLAFLTIFCLHLGCKLCQGMHVHS